jgi:uncharacterized membrane protein YhaH (DUF805 family)
MTFTQRLQAWFGWRGRLRRRRYWAMAFAAGAAFVILYVFLERIAGRAATLVLYPPFFACQLALAARRLHDQARGAGWLLLVAIPVLGPLVVAFLLLLRRGTDGENQHGPDPRVVGRDYLTVSAYEPG